MADPVFSHLCISLEDVHSSAENLLFLLEVNRLLSMEKIVASTRRFFDSPEAYGSMVISNTDCAAETSVDYSVYHPGSFISKNPLTISLTPPTDRATITLRSSACISPYFSFGSDSNGNILQRREFAMSPMEAVIYELKRLQSVRAND